MRRLRRRSRASTDRRCPTTRSSWPPTSGSRRRRASASRSTCWSATSTRWRPTTSTPTGRPAARFARHPEDKDATDLDLAIGGGGRRGRGRDPRRRWRRRPTRPPARERRCCWPLRGYAARRDRRGVRRGAAPRRAGRRELAGAPGELLSLFALGGPARGVRTEGLRWPLEAAMLEPGLSLGVSNRFLGERAASRSPTASCSRSAPARRRRVTRGPRAVRPHDRVPSAPRAVEGGDRRRIDRVGREPVRSRCSRTTPSTSPRRWCGRSSASAASSSGSCRRATPGNW